VILVGRIVWRPQIHVKKSELANGEGNTKTGIVNINVWKYEGDSLRRQFLWDLQAQLREQKIISRNKDYVKDYVAESYEGQTGELKPGFHSR